MQNTNRFNPLFLAAYLTILAAAVSAIVQVERILLRWQVILVLVVFAFLHSRLPADSLQPGAQRRANWLIGAQTLLVLYLLWTTRLGFSSLVLFFILSVNVALYNPLRLTLAWVAFFALVAGGFEFITDGWGSILREAPIFAGGYLFFGLVTNALTTARQAQAQNERLLAELRAKNLQLQEYAGQVETLAALEERNRLAREVHDTLGHRLTSSSVQLEAAGRLVVSNPEKASAIIETVRGQVRAALQELRQTVGRLRSPVELELSLPQALRRLAENFSDAAGFPVHLALPEALCEITPPQRLALYRAAQEGLTNIQRHAQARHAWLRLECDSMQLRLFVEDDGRGPQAPQPGALSFGLRGLHERAASLGGNVVLDVRPGGGARLLVALPVAAPAPQPDKIQDEAA